MSPATRTHPLSQSPRYSHNSHSLSLSLSLSLSGRDHHRRAPDVGHRGHGAVPRPDLPHVPLVALLRAGVRRHVLRVLLRPGRVAPGVPLAGGSPGSGQLPIHCGGKQNRHGKPRGQ